MSNDPTLQRYLDLYSKYVEHAVNLHNYHRVFAVTKGYDTGLGVRKSLRAMMKLERELLLASRAVSQEHLAKFRAEKLKAKEEKLAWKKANTRPVGRPKGTKNGQYSRTDETNI
jgi:hypothetical protein